MISCVWLEDKLEGEDPELIFYIVPELETNAMGYYQLPLDGNNTNFEELYNSFSFSSFTIPK